MIRQRNIISFLTITLDLIYVNWYDFFDLKYKNVCILGFSVIIIIDSPYDATLYSRCICLNNKSVILESVNVAVHSVFVIG